MDFKSAEKVINICAVMQLPLLVCGDNGIGKSEMLKAVQMQLKKDTVMVNALDFGGLTTLQVPDTISTMFISDLQVILGRRKTTQSTISALTALVTEYGMQSYMYNGRSFNRRTMLSFVIGCTPEHLRKLVRYGYRDFLSRFIVIFVEREQSDYKDSGYELHIKVIKKLAKNAKKVRKIIKISSNMREISYYSTFFQGRFAMGYDDSDFELYFGLPTTSKVMKNDDLRRLFKRF